MQRRPHTKEEGTMKSKVARTKIAIATVFSVGALIATIGPSVVPLASGIIGT
jgi:hypothetical protein